MDTFMTQFLMSGINTNVTVRVLSDNQFGFALHLSDPFEGGELVPSGRELDGVIMSEDGEWKLAGKSKVFLSKEDIHNLGEAINLDYLYR